LPKVQYFCYVEITKRDPQALWAEYQKLSEAQPELFAQRRVSETGDIYPVFRELFEKKVQAT
jgi:uncharacterized sporulation protein YeaH/YhbH (DUF444 family)